MALDKNEAARGWERFRKPLMLLAQRSLDPDLQGKVDVEVVVQQTLLEAEKYPLERAEADGVHTLALLRKILENNLIDEVRRVTGGKRDVRRERSIQAQMDESSARWQEWLAADHTSPSGRASKNEDVAHLREALNQLPADQRRAVEFKHLEGWTLAQIAKEMRRSEEAVSALLYRGLKRLQELLGQE
jgi:RNA polymerase sigma-70 factor (subfamily 1)